MLIVVLGFSARADSDVPRGILAVDAAANRVLWLSAATGELVREAIPANASELGAPFAAVRGPAIIVEGETHPYTILVSDIRRRRITVFDEITGNFLREWIGTIDAAATVELDGGTWFAAAGRDGVRAIAADGTAATRIPPAVVRGPNNAWGVLPRPVDGDRPADILVSDPTLDAVFRFDRNGARLGVFCRLAAFRFPQQLARRANGNVLLADPLANRVFEFDADGGLLREIACPHPRGVVELNDGNLLIASDDGVQVFDGAGGGWIATRLSGLPEYAIRMLTPVGCPGVGRGDLNGDGRVNAFDIDAFVLALTDETAFAAEYPLVDRLCAGDINRDGRLNSFDIDPFVALLVGG